MDNEPPPVDSYRTCGVLSCVLGGLAVLCALLPLALKPEFVSLTFFNLNFLAAGIPLGIVAAARSRSRTEGLVGISLAAITLLMAVVWIVFIADYD